VLAGQVVSDPGDGGEAVEELAQILQIGFGHGALP
jgi:hypothetical protein